MDNDISGLFDVNFRDILERFDTFGELSFNSERNNLYFTSSTTSMVDEKEISEAS